MIFCLFVCLQAGPTRKIVVCSQPWPNNLLGLSSPQMDFPGDEAETGSFLEKSKTRLSVVGEEGKKRQRLRRSSWTWGREKGSVQG